MVTDVSVTAKINTEILLKQRSSSALACIHVCLLRTAIVLQSMLLIDGKDSCCRCLWQRIPEANWAAWEIEEARVCFSARHSQHGLHE